MKTVRVALGERSYPIYVGNRLLGRRDLFESHISGGQVMVVTNDCVAPLYLTKTVSGIDKVRVESVVLPDGEEHKSLTVLNRVFDALLEHRCGRDTTIVALGGGVVGDMAGFAAACYQRGIPFVQVPTTLLAQVDSSVGGKTGVNHALGKNMIGAFHQPACVVADIDTLTTLRERELRAGLAEVIKYGLIGDSEFFEWLEGHVDAVLRRDPESLTHTICRSCENKAKLVSADEREASSRALLNLGHTFGHAIETGLGYGTWLHGEAVAAGMCQAADLSARLGCLDRDAVTRIEKLFTRVGLPVRAPLELEPERMLELMSVDKKSRNARMRLVLLRAIGDAFITDSVDSGDLNATLTAIRGVA